MHKKAYTMYFIALIIGQQLDPSRNILIQVFLGSIFYQNTYKSQSVFGESSRVIQKEQPVFVSS